MYWNMNNLNIKAVWIIFTLFVSMQATVEARRCYFCDSRGSYRSDKHCDEKNVESTKINIMNYRDDDKECVACSKIVDKSGDDKIVTRGCIGKDVYKDYKQQPYDFKNMNQCKTNNSIEVCLCQWSECNASWRAVTSLPLLMLPVLGNGFIQALYH